MLVTEAEAVVPRKSCGDQLAVSPFNGFVALEDHMRALGSDQIVDERVDSERPGDPIGLSFHLIDHDSEPQPRDRGDELALARIRFVGEMDSSLARSAESPDPLVEVGRVVGHDDGSRDEITLGLALVDIDARAAYES
ncbi:hypothetical protein [Leifsonia shinshuensis]